MRVPLKFLVHYVAVKLLAVNFDAIGVLPQEAFQKVFAVILRIPDRAVKTLPIDKIFKPRVGGIDACIERLDIVKEGAANISNVAFSESEEMTRLIVVAVFHIEENGQFE